MTEERLPPALFLMGPTASGKSALAVKLAQQFNGEIISVDSVLVYRGMDIGTAKPSLAERDGIVHHLIDILDPAQAYSTAQFRHQALELMAEITKRGKLPLLTGGTMLYFHAMFNGLVTLPEADQQVRQSLDKEAKRTSWSAMHQRLQQIDPKSAERIHPNDPQRIQRALEVFQLTGKPLSQHFLEDEQKKIPYQAFKLIIAPEHRSILHEKIAHRFNQMLDQGLIAEVESLYKRQDLSDQMPAIRAVGYRQVWQYLQGVFDYQTMTEKAIIATRQLAKRQFTWLRKFEDASWYDAEIVGLQAKIAIDLKEKGL